MHGVKVSADSTSSAADLVQYDKAAARAPEPIETGDSAGVQRATEKKSNKTARDNIRKCVELKPHIRKCLELKPHIR